MNNHIYLTTVVLLIAFTACVVTFVVTSSVFQYLLAIFNLGMLFNTLRIAIELEL